MRARRVRLARILTGTTRIMWGVEIATLLSLLMSKLGDGLAPDTDACRWLVEQGGR